MKIDGRAITSEILLKLSKRVSKLKKKGIIPTLAIILMGDNQASAIYVKQKTIKAGEIGAEVKLFQFGNNITNEKIEKLVKKLAKNPDIHGILLQRPAPKDIKVDELTELVPPEKEVDGFGTLSKFPVPVAQAAWVMLESVFKEKGIKKTNASYLKSKKIVVIGKGETAGKPITDLLIKNGGRPIVVDSHTSDKQAVTRSADIIISAVGKHVLNSSDIKKGVILIGVGLYRNEEGKIKGDYNDSDVMDVASFYSPTPGGVGPVNVACLMKNLVEAAELYS